MAAPRSFLTPENSVELPSIKAVALFSSMPSAAEQDDSKYVFRVWALNSDMPWMLGEETGDLVRRAKAAWGNWIFLRGPISSGPWSVRRLEEALAAAKRQAHSVLDLTLKLGDSSAGRLRFYLDRAQVKKILEEAKSVCFEHEDCRANFELGTACRAQRMSALGRT